jgi:heterodisulfide reductase subunit A-like polyferredoxin
VRQGAAVEPSLCTGCQLCVRSCVYGALRMVDQKALVDSSLCAACGLCATRCRFGAITLAEGPCS